MNYIFYIVILISAAVLLFLPRLFKKRLQTDFFGKMAVRRALEKHLPFFAGGVIADAVRTAVRHRQLRALHYLADGDFAHAAKQIAGHSPLTAMLLQGFERPQTAARKLKKYFKANPQDMVAAAYTALLLKALGDTAHFQALKDNINERCLPPYLKAHYKTWLAETALKNGDLEFASGNFYQAAKIFNRCRAFYEEGCVYLRLGTTYRICFVYDTAEALFRSALKTFELLHYADGIAQALANLGMLMTGQERFAEAEDYFQRAAEKYKAESLPAAGADIQNQLALLHLLQKNYKQAEKLLKAARSLHKKNQNTNGTAFSTELLANCSWGRCDFAATVRLAAQASGLYEKSGNVSGRLESLYLQAQALFRGGDDDNAEKILRQIIALSRQDCGCFYPANAYNLLGIIFVKRKDLQRAKGLFRQSLELEQRGVRTTAIAADYANLGLVEMRCGHQEEARRNLETALNLAKETEDEDLCKQLQQHLNKLNN